MSTWSDDEPTREIPTISMRELIYGEPGGLDAVGPSRPTRNMQPLRVTSSVTIPGDELSDGVPLATSGYEDTAPSDACTSRFAQGSGK